MPGSCEEGKKIRVKRFPKIKEDKYLELFYDFLIGLLVIFFLYFEGFHVVYVLGFFVLYLIQNQSTTNSCVINILLS